MDSFLPFVLLVDTYRVALSLISTLRRPYSRISTLYTGVHGMGTNDHNCALPLLRSAMTSDRSLITIAELNARDQAPALMYYADQAVENGVKPRG